MMQETTGTRVHKQAWGSGRFSPAKDWYFVVACEEAPFAIEMTYRGDHLLNKLKFRVHIARLDAQVRLHAPFSFVTDFPLHSVFRWAGPGETSMECGGVPAQSGCEERSCYGRQARARRLFKRNNPY